MIEGDVMSSKDLADRICALANRTTLNFEEKKAALQILLEERPDDDDAHVEWGDRISQVMDI